jgi:hypothetical protein
LVGCSSALTCRALSSPVRASSLDAHSAAISALSSDRVRSLSADSCRESASRRLGCTEHKHELQHVCNITALSTSPQVCAREPQQQNLQHPPLQPFTSATKLHADPCLCLTCMTPTHAMNTSDHNLSCSATLNGTCQPANMLPPRAPPTPPIHVVTPGN